MKRHSFTEHPHDENCWRCNKPLSDPRHKYKSTFYTRGQKPVVCLFCSAPILLAKTPAWHFLIGPHSTEWKQIWCRQCHTPHQYRRPSPKMMKKGWALEFRLVDDPETGREPEYKYKKI